MARMPTGTALGLTALVAVIVLFSLGSTLVKLAETPGITVAFWRMVLCCSCIWWAILWVTERRWLSRADLRASLVPGIAFGLNITVVLHRRHQAPPSPPPSSPARSRRSSWCRSGPSSSRSGCGSVRSCSA